MRSNGLEEGTKEGHHGAEGEAGCPAAQAVSWTVNFLRDKDEGCNSKVEGEVLGENENGDISSQQNFEQRNQMRWFALVI